VLGLEPCQTECRNPADGLGTILYNGGFDPEFRMAGLPPHQNFTIIIPSTTPKGKAVLGLTHIALIGVSIVLFFKGVARSTYDCECD